MKIIQIDGIKGLITAAFMGVCLFAGFVLFPGQVAMNLWNTYLASSFMFPTLDLLQGVLLWGIVAISYCIVSKKGLAVSFKNTPEISDDELDAIIRSAKISSQFKTMNKKMAKFDKFEMSKKETSIKSVKDEKETSYMSSPISVNESQNVEVSEEDSVSNVN